MPARRGKVDRGPAFEIPTQNEGIVVQQRSQAVLTARHSLRPAKRTRSSDLTLPSFNNRATPFFQASFSHDASQEVKRGSLTEHLATKETIRLLSRQPPLRRVNKSRRAPGLPRSRGHTHPSVQGSPSPLVRCIGCGSLLQEEVDTVNVAIHDRQHQRGSAAGRGSREESGLGRQLGSSIALCALPGAGPRATQIPRETPGQTHWPWMSMTSVMSARSPLSIRRCRESVFPLAAGDNA